MLFLTITAHMTESATLAKMTVTVIPIVLFADGVVSGRYSGALAERWIR